jgi:hypothetical protein
MLTVIKVDHIAIIIGVQVNKLLLQEGNSGPGWNIMAARQSD